MSLKFVFVILLVGVGCAVALKYGVAKNEQDTCKTSCLKFANFVRKSKSHYGKTKPSTMANLYCRSPLFNAEDDCDQVRRFSRFVFVYVKAGIPKRRICQFKKICPNKVEKSKTRGHENNVKQSILCTSCKTIVGTVSFGVKTLNFTEQKLKNFIESLCKLLAPLKIQSKVCKVVIDQIDKIIQMVLKGLTPGKICEELGICKNSTSTKDSLLMKTLNSDMLKKPLIESLPYYLSRAEEIQKGIPVVLDKYKIWSVNKKQKKDGEVCKVCMLVTNVVEEAIKAGNATIEIIEEAVKLICNFQPEPIKGICTGLLSKIDEIIQYIEKGLSPGDICKKLGLCPKKQSDDRLPLQASKLSGERQSTPVCKICDSIEKIFDKEMKNYKKSSWSLRSYLTDVCTTSQNEEIQKKCLTVAPVLVIIDAAIDNLMHPSVCRKIACSKVVELASSILGSDGKTSCDVCKYIVNIFTNRIKYFEEMFEKSLNEIDQLCNMVAYKEMADKCHLAVNKTRQLFQAVVKKFNPKTVCTALTFCLKTISQEQSLVEKLAQVMMSGTSPTCGICKVAIELMQEGRNVKVARKSLEASCQSMTIFPGKKVTSSFNLLPGYTYLSSIKDNKRQCKKLLKHMDTIVGNEGARKAPDAICKKIKLCEKDIPVMDVVKDVVDGIKDLFSDW
eukprot:gene7902-8756_t